MFKLCFFALSFMLLSYSNVAASIGRSTPACPFVGKVTEVSIRKELGKGISEGKVFTYIDVTVDIVSGVEENNNNNGILGCNITNGSIQIFQMHKTLMGKYARSVPSVGSCIKASAKVMADGNFMSGNWLTVNEKLPMTACTSSEN